jgi:hypothetical protein
MATQEMDTHTTEAQQVSAGSLVKTTITQITHSTVITRTTVFPDAVLTRSYLGGMIQTRTTEPGQTVETSGSHTVTESKGS